MPISSNVEYALRLRDALVSYTDEFEFVRKENPFEIKLNGVAISFVLHTVSSTSRAIADECRIQVRAENHRYLRRCYLRHGRIAILGYYPKLDVFTAWDPEVFAKMRNVTTGFTEYSRFSVQQRASVGGISIYIDSDNQNVVTMRPEFLGAYLENMTVFHSAPEAALTRVVSQFPDEKSVVPVEQKVHGIRKKIVLTRKQYPRDPRFVRAVKEAYVHSCAFCGIQLELVEAAHIVPHGKPDSSNEVGNGVLLCALHHKAFDQGLIMIGADFRLTVDKKRRQYLVHLGRDNGIGTVDRLVGRKMRLPADREHWPTSGNLGRRQKYY